MGQSFCARDIEATRNELDALTRARDEHLSEFPTGCVDKAKAGAAGFTRCSATGRRDHAVHSVGCFSAV